MNRKETSLRVLPLFLLLVVSCSDSDTSTDAPTNDAADTGTGSDTGTSTGNHQDTSTDTTTGSDTHTALGSVTGQVLLQNAVSHAGATVTLDGTSRSQSTSETGAYEWQDVPPGTYTVTASLAGYETRTSSAFEVTNGETSTAPTLTLPRATGGLNGTALLEGEDSHAGISVMVQGTSHAAITDANGAWSIANVAAGNYAIIAMRDGFKDATVSDQDVVAGQVTNVPTLTLAIPRSSIGGTVSLEGASDHSGASVVATASWNPSLTHSANSNLSGTYTISGVEPGMWNVAASQTNYGTVVRENVYVQATSPTVGVDFSLPYQPGGVATSIVYVSGGSNDSDLNQTGVVNSALTEPFVVEVRDGQGLLVPGTQVYFQVVISQTDGHMQNLESFILTDENGQASDTYVLGKVVGQNHVRAGATSVPGQFVNFYATSGPDAPDEVLATGGSDQDGVVGQALSTALSVAVQDAWDNATPGVTCSFAPSGDGAASPTSAATGVTGLTGTNWTLGTTMGSQTLTVTCGEAIHVFSATANHEVASALAKVGGDHQTGISTTTLTNPLVAEARDQYGNPVDGVEVSFAITTGSGTLDPSAPQSTDALGRASTSLTLSSLGAVTVTASAAGLSSVVFDATSLAGSPSRLVLVSGGGQEATVGAPLASPLVVRVEDSYDNPVASATAHFVPHATTGPVGLVEATNVVTNASGQASTAFTLGTLAGATAQWVEVTLNDFPSVATLTIPVLALPDEPATIEIVSGNNQLAAYGQQLAEPLVVQVEDQHGNPVRDELVHWSSTTGGTITPDPSLTNASGQATGTATLGSTPGMPNQDFTAVAGTANVTFAATATGHWIEDLRPRILWPGYPDPTDSTPQNQLVEFTITGGGFAPGAQVVWDSGTATEERFSPESLTDDTIVVLVSADHFVDLGERSVVVENPGPTACAEHPFHVQYTLPDTGQLWCADENDERIDCSSIALGDPMYGQDGHYEYWPGEQRHYIVHTATEPTVTDAITGLEWQGCAAGDSGSDCSGGSGFIKHKWTLAFEYCSGLEWAGFTDWRLPDVQELSSLADAISISPSIDATAFPNAPKDGQWSSSVYASNSAVAWWVTFDTSIVQSAMKTEEHAVRCVRGEPLASHQFQPSILAGDRLVQDNLTELMWQGCNAGHFGDSCESGSADTFLWTEALAYCEALSWGGHPDWRVPNISELQSIVDYSGSHPAVDLAVFPSTSEDRTWSSSTYSGTGLYDSALVVEFSLGSVTANGFKFFPYPLRCVRQGP